MAYLRLTLGLLTVSILLLASGTRAPTPRMTPRRHTKNWWR